MPYRANQVVALTLEGGGFQATDLLATYADDDPIVRAYPWAFDPAGEAPIERATARPGEKRTVRRSE